MLFAETDEPVIVFGICQYDTTCATPVNGDSGPDPECPVDVYPKVAPVLEPALRPVEKAAAVIVPYYCHGCNLDKSLVPSPMPPHAVGIDVLPVFEESGTIGMHRVIEPVLSRIGGTGESMVFPLSPAVDKEDLQAVIEPVAPQRSAACGNDVQPVRLRVDDMLLFP